MYFYRQLDENGNLLSLQSCSAQLQESETLISISEEEYEQELATLPEAETAPELLAAEEALKIITEGTV